MKGATYDDPADAVTRVCWSARSSSQPSRSCPRSLLCRRSVFRTQYSSAATIGIDTSIVPNALLPEKGRDHPDWLPQTDAVIHTWYAVFARAWKRTAR